MEDLIGGHYWVGISCLIGGVWHIQTRPLGIIVRGFTWSGEAYLSYSLSAIALCGSIAAIYSWYNNTDTQVNCMDQQVLKLLKHKGLHFWYVTRN